MLVIRSGHPRRRFDTCSKCRAADRNRRFARPLTSAVWRQGFLSAAAALTYGSCYIFTNVYVSPGHAPPACRPAQGQRRSELSKRLRVFAAFGLVCGLLVTAPIANAVVEPGGWIAVSPSFRVQEAGCGDVSNLTFRLTCSSRSGVHRAERRYATYTGGTHQFEGFFRITSMGGSRISLKQTFARGPYFLLAVERGGRLYVVGRSTIATGATVGTTVRVNTVHVVGRSHRTYINGSLRHTMASPGGSFYDKFGAYRTASGSGPITVVWSDIRFWRK